MYVTSYNYYPQNERASPHICCLCCHFFFYHDFLDTKIPVRVVIDLSDCSIHCRKLLSCYAITLITSCTWECIHVLNNGNMTVNIFETLHSEHIRHFTHSKIQMHHQLCWSSGFNLMMTAVLQMITSMALKIVMFGSTYRCKMWKVQN